MNIILTTHLTTVVASFLSRIASTGSCASTSGCLGGNAFEDFNCNGTDETNEPGVKGVQVIIYDCNNTAVDTTWTNAQGDWQICGLTDGTAYRVEHILPETIACLAERS